MTELGIDEQPKFTDWVRLLRYWLAMKNVPDREQVRIEVIFPNGRAKFEAFAHFRQEFDPMTASFLDGMPEPEGFQLEGVRIVFSDPTRYDHRVVDEIR